MVTGANDSEYESSDDGQVASAKQTLSKQETKPAPVSKKEAKKKGVTQDSMVTFDDADLGMFNAEKKKLIKEDDAVEISKQTEGASKKTDEQEQLLKSLFVTQEDEAMDEFE